MKPQRSRGMQSMQNKLWDALDKAGHMWDNESNDLLLGDKLLDQARFRLLDCLYHDLRKLQK